MTQPTRAATFILLNLQIHGKSLDFQPSAIITLIGVKYWSWLLSVFHLIFPPPFVTLYSQGLFMQAVKIQ